MSKQVEVPESAVAAVGELRWGRGWQLLDAAPEPVTRAREDEIRRYLAAAVPSLYKHFSDRLLSDPFLWTLKQEWASGASMHDAVKVALQCEQRAKEQQDPQACECCGKPLGAILCANCEAADDEEDWPAEITVGRETLAGRTTEMFLIPPAEVADRSASEFVKTRRYLPATSQDSEPQHPGGAYGEGEDAVEVLARLAKDSATRAQLLKALEAEGWQLVHAVSQDSSGLQKAREEGEEAASARLYAFFDDDEYPEAQLRSKLAFESRRADEAVRNARAQGDEAEEHRRARQRAETALEELGEEFEKRADARSDAGSYNAWASAASLLRRALAREKAAELKEGNGG